MANDPTNATMPILGSRWKKFPTPSYTNTAEYEVVLIADNASRLQVTKIVYKNVRSGKYFTLPFDKWYSIMEKVCDICLDSLIQIDSFEDEVILISYGKRAVSLKGTASQAIDLARIMEVKSVQAVKDSVLYLLNSHTKTILSTRPYLP